MAQIMECNFVVSDPCSSAWGNHYWASTYFFFRGGGRLFPLFEAPKTFLYSCTHHCDFVYKEISHIKNGVNFEVDKYEFT